jgi:hypothetical protein
VTAGLDGAFRAQLISAVSIGLLRAARRFETDERSTWLCALAATIGVVASFFDVRLLDRQGATARAPDWFFSSARLPTTHAVVEQTKNGLRARFDDDNRIRKDVDALRRGRSQQATIDELQRLQTKPRGQATRLSYDLLIEQIVVDFNIDFFARLMLLTLAEDVRACRGHATREELIFALQGHIFDLL